MPKKIKIKAKAKIQKTVAKKPVKKPAAKKIIAKKATVKKPVMKKMMAKKSAPKKPVAMKKPVTKPVAKKTAAKKPVMQKPQVQKIAAAKALPPKPVVQQSQTYTPKSGAPKPQIHKTPVPKAVYKVGNYVVYPTHGVGRIMAEETQMIGDHELRMLVIAFEKDKMTLRVPVHRAKAAGLRPVSSADQMKKVFLTLKSRARTSRGMWSRRAQEYEAKINSGNIFFIAEVVRDLHQNVDQSERSYSERMIYESALARLVGELAAAEGTDHKTATDKLMKLLRAKVAAAAAAALEAKEAA